MMTSTVGAADNANVDRRNATAKRTNEDLANLCDFINSKSFLEQEFSFFAEQIEKSFEGYHCR